MAKSHNNQSSAPATTADLHAMKTEIINAVKDTMKGLATQDRMYQNSRHDSKVADVDRSV
jgi:hypothetical protein